MLVLDSVAKSQSDNSKSLQIKVEPFVNLILITSDRFFHFGGWFSRDQGWRGFMGDPSLSLAHEKALNEGETHFVVWALEHRDEIGES